MPGRRRTGARSDRQGGELDVGNRCVCQTGVGGFRIRAVVRASGSWDPAVLRITQARGVKRHGMWVGAGRQAEVNQARVIRRGPKDVTQAWSVSLALPFPSLKGGNHHGKGSGRCPDHGDPR